MQAIRINDFQPALLPLKGNTTESQLLLVMHEHLVSQHLLSAKIRLSCLLIWRSHT